MSHSLPFLIGLVAPTAFAVKYLLQIAKAPLQAVFSKDKAVSDFETRAVAVALGAIALPLLAYFVGPYFAATPHLTLQDAGGAVAFGAAAGFVAIGDYHLLSALESLVSGKLPTQPPTP